MARLGAALGQFHHMIDIVPTILEAVGTNPKPKSRAVPEPLAMSSKRHRKARHLSLTPARGVMKLAERRCNHA